MTQHTDDVTTVVERAFSHVDLNTPVEQILGRGRQLHTRRRAATGGLIVAVAAVALAIPLSHLADNGSRAVAQSPAATAGADGNSGVQVDLAAFSVHTTANGTVKVTVRQLFDPATLSAILAKAGVPAIVTVRHGQPAFTCNGGTADMMVLLRRTVDLSAPGSDGQSLTIRPSLIPHGGKIEFDYIFSPTVNGSRPVVGVSFRDVQGADGCATH